MTAITRSRRSFRSRRPVPAGRGSRRSRAMTAISPMVLTAQEANPLYHKCAAPHHSSSIHGGPPMGKTIEFKRPDGKTCPGSLSTAGNAPDASRPGFVVIQEWWGLNDQIKKTADRLADAGYRALVPDLYRGKVASAADEASHMM